MTYLIPKKIRMKLKHNNKTVYVKYVSSDHKYALVTEDESKTFKIYKVDVEDLEGLNKRNLNKFKRFATMNYPADEG